MPTYTYRCLQTGERRDLRRSIHNAPPEVFQEGTLTWHRVWDASTMPAAQVSGGAADPEGLTPAEQRRLAKLRSTGAVAAIGNGLPVSRSLPRRNTKKGQLANRYGHSVVEYKDGGVSDVQGRPVIDGHAARSRELGRTGSVDG